MMAPSIAIAVPIGAYHPLLRDCLASLAAQSPPPVISVLDASGDPRTASALDEFSSAIAYRRSGKDGGQTAAILEGWREAPGEVLGWLNADDALYPGALGIVSRHFSEHPDTDVFYGHTVIINDDFEVTGFHWAVEPPSEAILSGCTISQPSCFFRRDAYERAGGLDAARHYTMDWDLWTRLWTSGAKFEFEDVVLSRVLWSRNAKTGGFGGSRRAELGEIIDRHNPPLRRLKSRIGFGLHHFLEYSAPRWAADLVRNAHGGQSKQIRGIGRNGELSTAAELPVASWGPNELTTLIVDIDATGPVRVEAGSVVTEAAGGKTTLATEIAPGETALVRFRPAVGVVARLKAVKFV